MTRTTWLGAMAALFLLLLAGLIPAAAAQTPGACGTGPLRGDRVALLIGNSAYDGYSWAALANSRNDVAHICSTLTDAGYAVRVVADAEQKALLTALDRFAAETAGAGTVVVYYAGHGFQYAQKNYVVPTDAPPMTRRSDLDLRFVSLETIARRVVPEGAVALFLVDACRTADPVVRLADQPAVATEGGVGPIGLLSLPRGAVLYSTAIGAPAYDDAPVGSRLSPFATAAGRYLAMPLPLTTMFGAIESEVPELTEGMPRGEQEPFHYGRKLSGLYMVEPKKLDPAMVAPLPSDPAAPSADAPGRAGATRGGALAIAPLDLPLARLAVEDEPIIVARLLARRSTADIAALAQSGDPAAQHILGYMLEFGVGVSRDLDAARAWLARSAAAGYAPGQLEYGYLLLLASAPGTPDHLEGERLYRAAAASGYAKAKTHLAYQLTTGGFGRPDREAAKRLFVEAAEAGHPVAMFFAATDPATRDDMTARLRGVAQSGNVEGNLWLCELGFYNSNVAAAFNDCSIAARSSVLSGNDSTAETAHANAMAIVALAYRSGEGVEANPAMARQWAMRAVEAQDLRPELRAVMDPIIGK
jgi:TPR repeat protein